MGCISKKGVFFGAEKIFCRGATKCRRSLTTVVSYTYFKHFVETEDNEGNPIKATKNGKFQENPAKYDLSAEEVSKIRSKIYRHSKQATSNQDKINKLKEDDK